MLLPDAVLRGFYYSFQEGAMHRSSDESHE